ncbi:CyP450 monooxygenase [Lentinus tigrinus ALCF2SS1-7]|uniref:CyP450 monooxygenase n=1 Tax=Lentinus tigrinus ALCF2SS1-6 TaxID=1328759 RepID=A0A5C2SFZ3_9APHY|nr:CyP450 monooxygenase [Lentinus tigrinus ALCF2SS1-6]RPD77545.1 CyP450 monooxygenase [Lentinus tigrinus ALCF2SS1-7]
MEFRAAGSFISQRTTVPLLVFTLTVFLYLRYRASWHSRCRGLPLPPGPKCIPYIGNVSHMRKPEIWKAHRELCEKYGDIVYVPVLGQRIMILGSPRVITDLLDKRSSVTSDRMQSAIIELSGQDSNFAMYSYGRWWKLHRRAFWQHFLPAASEKYLDIQKDATRAFLQKLLADPSRLCEHIRYTFRVGVVKVVYGIPEQDDHQYVAMMEKVLDVAEAFTPGRYLVEFMPFLRHIPAWVPGAGFQHDFAGWRNVTNWVRNNMVEKTREGMVNGETSQSIVAQLLEQMDEEDAVTTADKQDIIKNVALTAYEGGAETTYSTLRSFFVAMVLNPDVQRKAQAELDAVVGSNRLPEHNDLPNLPYIEAIHKEVLRWAPVLPFSLPHMTSEDIEYNGYFIPAGTLILPNSWACLHDPKTYPEPERFMPERFLRDGKLNPEVSDPAQFAFGYGRRVCPGRHFADASLFINIAMVLHVFDITPPLDENGNPIQIEMHMANRLVSHPMDVRCTITPRSEKARELILT